DVHLLETRRINTEIGGAILYDAERRLRALAHDFAELAGEDQPATPRCAGSLDEQDVAADRRPGKAGGDAGDACAHRQLALELGRTEHGGETVDIDRDRSSLPFGDAHGGMAQGLAELSFEVAHASFARVVLNNRA